MVEAGRLHGTNRELLERGETAPKKSPKPKTTPKHRKEDFREDVFVFGIGKPSR